MNDQAILNRLEDLIQKAKRAGADAADAIWTESLSQGVSVRMGALEDIERSENHDLGLRVFIGQRQAFVAATALDAAAMDELVARAVSMARLAPEDPFCGLAAPQDLARDWPDYDLHDPTDPAPDTLIEMARTAEEAARAVPGVTNSEGAGASAGHGLVALVTSQGFAGLSRGSSFSFSVSVIAGEGTGMERDYDSWSSRHFSDLAAPQMIGHSAGHKAVARLNPRKIASGAMPIVFDPRVGRSLIGHFASAVNGAGVARGTSFLKNKMGQKIFADGVTVIDDPTRRRGLASRPFDGEGVAGATLTLVKNGVLQSWLLDTSSAKQLGLQTNGRASRGTGGPPGPSSTNMHIAAGAMSPTDLMADIKRGFYVTELIGFGVNGVTGDYSRGASGFLIEDGRLGPPVSELTIAGNLKDMFLNLTPANDLEFRYGMNAPTLRVDGMTVAGQ